MSSAKQGKLQLQRLLAKSLLQAQEPETTRLPVVPYRKDRMQFSQDILIARDLKAPVLSVHKLNPHTTYLSELDLFVEMINEVSQAQETVKTQQAEEKAQPVKPAAEKKPKSAATPAKKPVRKASTPKSRMLPSGAIIIR